MDFLKYINPGIESINPYEAGKSIEEVMEKYNLEDIVKLASNENNSGPSPRALKVIKYFKDLHIYPDGDAIKLKTKISEVENIDSDQIIIGNGSNEILEIISKTFLSSNTESIFSKHAFIVYKLVSKVCGSKFHEIDTCDWGHDLDKFLEKINDKTRLIFIANPNNPTGTYLSHKNIIDFLNKVPKQVLVVIDLAYFEYVTANDYVKTSEILNKFNNVLFTKSFSKIHGLSALRIGYGFGNKSLIEIMNRVRQPFNVNALAQKAAIESLSDKNYIEESISQNTKERLYLCESLSSIGVEYIPSQGNFICINTKITGKNVFESLLKKGVIVRPIDIYEMPTYIRVSVGNRNENNIFIEKLEEILF